MLLWSAIAAHATAQPSVIVDAAPGTPLWAVEVWRETGPVVGRALEERFGYAVPVIVSASYREGSIGSQNINGHAHTGIVDILLEGAAWSSDNSPRARRDLEQNLAHEMAHLWQLSAYDSPFEPLWLHEGFAEALALEALTASGLWSADQAAQWEDAQEARCAVALSKGILAQRVAVADRDAIYGCGYIAVRMMAEDTGKAPSALFEDYVPAIIKGPGLANLLKSVLDPIAAERLRSFLHVDYSRADGRAVIRRYRAGRPAPFPDRPAGQKGMP